LAKCTAFDKPCGRLWTVYALNLSLTGYAQPAGLRLPESAFVSRPLEKS